MALRRRQSGRRIAKPLELGAEDVDFPAEGLGHNLGHSPAYPEALRPAKAIGDRAIRGDGRPLYMVYRVGGVARLTNRSRRCRFIGHSRVFPSYPDYQRTTSDGVFGGMLIGR